MYKIMQNNIFLVFGYGVPRDILNDENYSFYLKMALNRIYDIAEKSRSEKNIIIPCGGPTDCFEPYTRTESEEMVRFFEHYLASKPFLADFYKSLVFLPEKKSIATLENLLNSKKIIEQKKLQGAVYVFCEKTREVRLKKLAHKVLGAKTTVVSIDFDISLNRYVGIDVLRKKEAKTLKIDLWALENNENFKKYHRLYQKRLRYLREKGPSDHANAVKAWNEEFSKLGIE